MLLLFWTLKSECLLTNRVYNNLLYLLYFILVIIVPWHKTVTNLHNNCLVDALYKWIFYVVFSFWFLPNVPCSLQTWNASLVHGYSRIRAIRASFRVVCKVNPCLFHKLWLRALIQSLVRISRSSFFPKYSCSSLPVASLRNRTHSHTRNPCREIPGSKIGSSHTKDTRAERSSVELS